MGAVYSIKPTIRFLSFLLFRQRHFLLLFVAGVLLPVTGWAAEEGGPLLSLWAEISAGFSTETTLMTYAEKFESFDSTQNPDNLFINFPADGAGVEFRNETRLQFHTWEATASPRLAASWLHWDSGLKQGKEEDDYDLYLQYGRLRWNPVSSLIISYGRENLQWGPSYLSAPSNPFFPDNGKQNPHLEIDGKEFARVVWLPSFDWTLSLIYQDANGPDSDDSPYFSKAMAMKADFMGDAHSAGIIFSADENHHIRAGGYGTRAVGEAMLLYGEGALGYGTSSLYPVSAENLFGAELAPQYENDRRGFVNLLVGSTYTFMFGPTLVLEYLYYGEGYDLGQWRKFSTLRAKAQDAFLAMGPPTPVAVEVLRRTADPGLRFLRRNYLMGQLHQSDVGDWLDYSARWTQNLDDGSRQVSLTADLYAADRLTLFAVGALNFGAEDKEFTSFLSHYAMAGFEFCF